jgi:hypothetical protein
MKRHLHHVEEHLTSDDPAGMRPTQVTGKAKKAVAEKTAS